MALESREGSIAAAIRRVFSDQTEKDRDARVARLVQAIEDGVRDLEPEAAEEILGRTEALFPVEVSALDNEVAALRNEMDALRRENATLREKAKRGAETGAAGTVRAYLAMDPQSAPTVAEGFDFAKLADELLVALLRFVDKTIGNLNHAFVGTGIEFRLPDFRETLERALAEASTGQIGPALDHVRDVLKILVGDPLGYIQKWCEDTKKSFRPERFLETAKGPLKKAGAFDHYEEFFQSFDFYQDLVPKIRNQIKGSLRKRVGWKGG